MSLRLKLPALSIGSIMAVERWSLAENWRMIADELVHEELGFFVLAAGCC